MHPRFSLHALDKRKPHLEKLLSGITFIAMTLPGRAVSLRPGPDFADLRERPREPDVKNESILTLLVKCISKHSLEI